MRFTSATALAFAGALFVAHVHAAPQAMQDTSRKVPGGGITAPGWQGKVDAGEADKGDKIEDSKVVMAGSELKFTNGPAAIYWNPANKAAGSYTVSATFTEPKYMSSNDHPHPYGVFVSGNDLDSDKATALYCAVYGNGNVIVRAFPTAFAPMGNRRPTASEAAHKAAGKGETVTQTVSMSVKGDKVDCRVNGTSVATLNKADLVGDGKLKSLDGFAGIRVAHNGDVSVKDFKVTK